MAPAWNQLNRLQLGKYAEYLVKMESQVGKGTPYVFLQKSKFKVHPSLLLALIQFVDGDPPTLFLIRSCVADGPNQIFESRDYGDGKKVEPEWGLTKSKKKLAALANDFGFQAVVAQLT
jgi:hypothetical protein